MEDDQRSHVEPGDVVANETRNSDMPERVQVLEPIHYAPTADSLAQFDVSTDSVVVTVRLATTKPARRIFIDWGDDQHDTFRVRPGFPNDTDRHAQWPGGDDPLPVGTYEFHHAYELPPYEFDPITGVELPFRRTFLVHVESADGSDDFRLTTVRLVPRFRVVQYRAYLYLLDLCDLLNAKSELRITQTVGDRVVNRWRWEPDSNFYPVQTVLEGSQFSVEMSTETDHLSNEYTPRIPVKFEFREIDPGPDAFGIHNQPILNFQIHLNTANVDHIVELSNVWSGSVCRIRIRYDRVAILIRNVPPPGSDWPVFLPADS
jgi:hypothetical protein